MIRRISTDYIHGKAAIISPETTNRIHREVGDDGWRAIDKSRECSVAQQTVPDGDVVVAKCDI